MLLLFEMAPTPLPPRRPFSAWLVCPHPWVFVDDHRLHPPPPRPCSLWMPRPPQCPDDARAGPQCCSGSPCALPSRRLSLRSTHSPDRHTAPPAQREHVASTCGRKAGVGRDKQKWGKEKGMKACCWWGKQRTLCHLGEVLKYELWMPYREGNRRLEASLLGLGGMVNLSAAKS